MCDVQTVTCHDRSHSEQCFVLWQPHSCYLLHWPDERKKDKDPTHIIEIPLWIMRIYAIVVCEASLLNASWYLSSHSVCLCGQIECGAEKSQCLIRLWPGQTIRQSASLWIHLTMNVLQFFPFMAHHHIRPSAHSSTLFICTSLVR